MACGEPVSTFRAFCPAKVCCLWQPCHRTHRRRPKFRTMETLPDLNGVPEVVKKRGMHIRRKEKSSHKPCKSRNLTISTCELLQSRFSSAHNIEFASQISTSASHRHCDAPGPSGGFYVQRGKMYCVWHSRTKLLPSAVSATCDAGNDPRGSL
jgi:hypothetical protein